MITKLKIKLLDEGKKYLFDSWRYLDDWFILPGSDLVDYTQYINTTIDNRTKRDILDAIKSYKAFVYRYINDYYLSFELNPEDYKNTNFKSMFIGCKDKITNEYQFLFYLDPMNSFGLNFNTNITKEVDSIRHFKVGTNILYIGSNYNCRGNIEVLTKPSINSKQQLNNIDYYEKDPRYVNPSTDDFGRM